MNKSSVFPVDPSISLEDLRRVVEDKEYYTGRLIAVSPYKQEGTWLTYSLEDTPKKSILVTKLESMASPPLQDGYELICIGDCFIGNQATAIAVYRKNR